ncbi:GNAT family N-acetyltransferase [Brevibacillus borstelensis]|uniref:GNAT family N-acetyltransferase n=1 Tax=Brevibacillus borstelensis TaxID=45462 RepID=UPI002E244C85|nr:GNAT family N-acetyltransferase [Brevibacillus borstelensis]
MKIIKVSPIALTSIKATLLRFVRLEGERRITAEARDWLAELTPEKLKRQEAVLLAAVEGKRLVGLFAVSKCGLAHSFLVVDRRRRGHGIGKAMASRMCRLLPKLYVRIAIDNEPSLALFRSLGFAPAKACIGPTGKPTLWLAYGQWTPEDLQVSAE